MTAHIYIYGEIGFMQDEMSAEFGIVNLKDVKKQYDAQADCEDVTVHIHSIGGVVWEGFAIHDYLRSQGKPITTIIEGVCYSIATVIALAGDMRIMTSNSEFMIHNPWIYDGGDAEQLEKTAASLRKTENRAADFYAAKTSINSEKALALMKVDTFMNPEMALEYGFITEIASVMKAVAKYQTKDNEMAKENKSQKETKNKVDGILAKLGNLLTGGQSMKMVIAGDGETEIEFPDLADDDTPSVGDTATIDGSAAEGEQVMPSGETYVFTAGELTEIKPDEEEDDEEEDTAAVDALTEENASLKEQLAALKKDKAKMAKSAEKNTSMIKDVQAEMKLIKKSIGSDFQGDEADRPEPETGGKSRQLFKPKK